MPFQTFTQFHPHKESGMPPRRMFKRTRSFLWIVLIGVGSSLIVGFGAGVAGGYLAVQSQLEGTGLLHLDQILDKLPKKEVVERQIVEKEYIPQTSQEQKIIDVSKVASGSVVSIVITKEIPMGSQGSLFDELFGTPLNGEIKRQEVGGGTGFIVSKDGLVLTNKHVVRDESADYSIFTSTGDMFPATVIAKDPMQDLAVLKIDQQGSQASFTPLKFGDSDNLQIGQTVVAVGNALGEFRNTISVGVISGLGRTVTASGGDFVETIEDVIQTDAAINRGNSGGPLFNLAGEVIGINTATVIGAQNIGFSIPINDAKRALEQASTTGKITYPLLGVRYVTINKNLQQLEDLPVDYGALVLKGEDGQPAVSPGSAAAKAGIKADDIILEVNGDPITQEYTLGEAIKKHEPGELVVIKILRNEVEKIVSVVLGEISG